MRSPTCSAREWRGKRSREIEEIDGAVKSVEVALASVGPGDLLLVQVDLVDETVALIKRQFTSQGEGEIDLQEAWPISATGWRQGLTGENRADATAGLGPPRPNVWARFPC